MKAQFRHFIPLFRRDFFSLLTTPGCWGLMACYLFFSSLLALTIGGFIEGNRAELTGFFVWQPWLYMLLCPVLAGILWRPEHHCGCLELLDSWPLSKSAVVLSKFSAGFLWSLSALLLTFPLPVICCRLGNPDVGIICCGYTGCLLALCFFNALSHFATLLLPRSFGSVLLAFLLGIASLLPGFRPAGILMLKWGLPANQLDRLASLSLPRHIEWCFRGVLNAGDVLYFLLLTLLFLFVAIRCASHRQRPAGQKAIAGVMTAAIALFLAAAVAALSTHPMPHADWTEEKRYSVDNATKRLIEKISPTTVTIHYSRSIPELTPEVRERAARTRQLLQQLSRSANGKLTIRFSEPLTDTEQQQLEELGLTPHIASMGELWFIGADISCGGQRGILPDLTNIPEEKLEYFFVSLISQLQQPRRPVLGILSSLPLSAHIDAESKRYQPEWWIRQQLSTQYDLRDIPLQSSALGGPVDALLIIHPTAVNPELVKAIREYLFNGGKALFCCDPLNKVAESNQSIYQLARPSYANDLINDFGIALYGNRVLADRAIATAMTDPERGIEKIPTLITLTPENFNRRVPAIAALQKLSFFCPGVIKIIDESKAEITTLLSSTTDAHILPIFAARRTPADLLKEYQPDKISYSVGVIARRKNHGAIAVIADADFLHNSLCVNITKEADGSSREHTLNDNGLFMLNLLDTLRGHDELIGVRSRGRRIGRNFRQLEVMAQKTENAIMAIDQDAESQRKALQRQRGDLRKRLEAAPDSVPLKSQLKLIEQQQSTLERRTKIAQRNELRILRLKMNAVERKVFFFTAILLPMILLLTGAVVWHRRRDA